MLKLGMRYGYLELLRPAAFGRLCVETRMDRPSQTQHIQPPSGGCVLKQDFGFPVQPAIVPAAFGRLCVETSKMYPHVEELTPAAFGRLCVETMYRWAHD